MSFIIDDDILELQGQEDGVDIHRQLPLSTSQGLHEQIACRIPTAQRWMTAEDGHRLPLLQLGG